MNNADLESKIQNISNDLINDKGFICSIDVLMQLGYLSQTDYENWRFGRIDYLEKVCKVNLGKLSTINRLIKFNAKKMSLKPSWTEYKKYGKGVKVRLRFSKTGIENIEKGYSTHYVSTYVKPE